MLTLPVLFCHCDDPAQDFTPHRPDLWTPAKRPGNPGDDHAGIEAQGLGGTDRQGIENAVHGSHSGQKTAH